MKKPKILVVGSFVMDLIVTAERFPNIGESVIGKSFLTAPGGKGANQAVQAARLGAEVTMVGMVGSDDFGTALLNSLEDSGVDISHVKRTDKASTAIGNIQLQSNENGVDNRIIIVPGANYEITTQDVAFLKDEISKFDILILQQEIPKEVNLEVAKLAKAANVPVMLNPAPYREISDDLYECLSYISPNEHEAADMTGVELNTEENIITAVNTLKKKGVGNVLITLGERGCAFSNGKNLIYGESIKQEKVVDTTAAGDSFVAAFCTAISSGLKIEQALIFANCTAGITVSRMGAQPSLPKLEEVKALLKEKGYSNFVDW